MFDGEEGFGRRTKQFEYKFSYSWGTKATFGDYYGSFVYVK